jgi:hypothetical protein
VTNEDVVKGYKVDTDTYLEGPSAMARAMKVGFACRAC